MKTRQLAFAVAVVGLFILAVYSFVAFCVLLFYGGDNKEIDRNRLSTSIIDNEKEPFSKPRPFKLPFITIPILVFACNRTSVTVHLAQLLKYRPDNRTFPIIVSFDQCPNHEAAKQAIITAFGPDVVTVIQQPDDTRILAAKHVVGYYQIARHYKWALDQIFLQFNYSAVIITEDDLNIAPDFFEYFTALYPLLLKDESIWCISAWNENGRKDLILSDRPDLLHRTDFFPGLGWMLRRELWLQELRQKWPRSFWDDWMRHSDQRKGRACIRPEINRTTTFGRFGGVSRGQYFDKYLKFIQLNADYTPFTEMDMSPLEKQIFDDNFNDQVYAKSALINYFELQDGNFPTSTSTSLRIIYHNQLQFKAIAKHLVIPEDFKNGVMRMAYRGVVITAKAGHRLFIVPERGQNWTHYDSAWV